MITDRRKFTVKWSLYGMSIVSIFTVIINSYLYGMYAAHQKGIYPNFWQSLTVTEDVLLSHDAKVNKPMWACQLCDVASVNKQAGVSSVEYASGKCPLRAYIAVCLQIHCNPSSFNLFLLSCSDTELLVHV